MNKGMIISYFSKETKEKYISSSATQLALKLDVHRNTITNRLVGGYYEDEACLMFCIDRQDFISRLRDKAMPTNPITRSIIKPPIVQPVRVIAQPSIEKETKKRSIWELMDEAR